MKRSDLTVGTDYLESSSNTWWERGISNTAFGNRRVRVLSDEGLAIIDYRSHAFARQRAQALETITYQGQEVEVAFAYRAGRGTKDGVAVAPVDSEGNPMLNKAYAARTRDLRATWEEGVKAITAHREREQAQQDAKFAALKAKQARHDAIVERLVALGVEHDTLGRYAGSPPRVGFEGLERLLDIAERKA